MSSAASLSQQPVLAPPPPPLRAVTLRLPWTAPGYAAAAVSFITVAIMFAHFIGLVSISGEKMKTVLLVRMAADSAGMLYWVCCMYRLHKILRIASEKRFPLSPGWAVVRFFVPIYSLIWTYKWPNRVAHFLKQQRPDLQINVRWPGALALTAMLLGFAGVRGFLLFALLSYLTRRTEQVVRVEAIPPHLRRSQVDLATSAGLGAGFGLVLWQAVLEFSRKPWPDMLGELVVVAAVSVGIIKFIEPLAEWVKHGFHLKHHQAPAAKSWTLRMAVLMAIAFSSFSHDVLEKYLENNPLDALRSVLAVLLVSGGITYAWASGARCHPSRACRRGLISGASIVLIVLMALWTDPVAAKQKISDTPEAAHQVSNISGPLGVSVFAGAEVTSLRAAAIPLCFWTLFGLVGGRAIDRGWRKGKLSAVVLSVLVSALLVIVSVRLGGYVESTEVALGVSAVLGWCLSLLLFPSAETLLHRHELAAQG
jgi:hypothetical protein